MAQNLDYVGKQAADAERARPKPVIEERRQWAHGPLPQGKHCYRSERPIFTPTQKVPDNCRNCGNDEWTSKGVVKRIKGTGQVIG